MSVMPGGPVSPQGREGQQQSVEAAVGAPDAGAEGAEWDDLAGDAADEETTDGTGGGTGAGAGGAAEGTGVG